METVSKITDIQMAAPRKEVFRMLNCGPDCASYEFVSELYEEILEETLAVMEPLILYRLGEIREAGMGYFLPEGTKVIYAVSSVGGEVSRRSTEAFQKGDPMLGMMLNAIADSALFHMEESLERILQKDCSSRRLGIAGRLEAPEDMPMEAQELIYRQTCAKELGGMEISSGYMLNPIKSSAVIFQLTEEEGCFRVRHDCTGCSRKKCHLRKTV